MTSQSSECLETVSQVDEWVAGHLTADARWQIDRHLSGCSSCSDHYHDFPVYLALMNQLRAPVDLCSMKPWVLESYLNQKRTWKTRSHLGTVLEELLNQPKKRQLVLIQNRSTFQTTQFCQFLLDEATSLTRLDPNCAKNLGELAVLACRTMWEIQPPAAARTVLYVRSLILLANLSRIASDLAGAESNFNSAETVMRSENMTGTDMWAEHLRLLGHLRAAQRRFTEAAEAFDDSISVYGNTGDLNMEGRSTIDKGSQVGEACDSLESLKLLNEGYDLMMRTVPRIQDILVMKHNSLMSLVEMGRVGEATQLLPEVRTLHTERQQPDLLLRLQWVESQLALACRDFRLAENLLLSVKAGFLDFDMPYDVALASLHLAVLYMEEGRWSEIPPLISEMLTVFQALRIDREAIAAVFILKRAMDVERLSLALLREAVSYFRRAQEDPGVRFKPSHR